MAPKHARVFPTVDIVLVVNGSWVVLIKRAYHPFEDHLVFPGGHVDEGETTLTACVRECKEEVGLDLRSDIFELFMVLDDPSRDPRPDHTLSIVYLAHIDSSVAAQLKADTDAKQVLIRLIGDLTEEEMGFDHWKIIAKLRERLWHS
ncbi:MAG: hypothetical protein UX57_C0027G0004 [Candidatus Uhrbacteria bacterium GW2011_GWE2_46_68]|uniref:Nudix hydrolase domain-containing protein n=2 Tax=Candidatus Uhriibacteriota TaxID=1752732 RepID=A0A0G1Q4Z2_9BACT|nr:MAG: hypothetical protein UX45_C0042G0004 [Candidatus Uhrbacteria bacterium GW2011_GWF2_46_218]KKU40044.1 MAG: hypothetical protein UX57_C0027G0004 [Candidatus Uhrbacteria bacterium GW2011_GWE2_46_68]